MDSYRYCTFGCRYCFMRGRVIGKGNKKAEANVKWLRNRFKKVYDNKDIDKENFMDMLLKNKITLNFGTKSDPFQPIEKEKSVTKEIVDICNEYEQSIIFTTKGDNCYDVNINPENHAFQLSITNHYNDRFLEPNVPDFEKRVEFYRKLKDEGFKVGIRFEPFIPNITDMREILKHFDDVDNVHISRLRLLPQAENKENNEEILKHSGLSWNDFHNTGLNVLKGDVWWKYVEPTVDWLKENGYSFSTSFIHMGNTDSLAGNVLGKNWTPFSTFYIKEKYGDNWTMEDGLNEIGEYRDCLCYSMWTSNRRYGCRTVEDFYRKGYRNPQQKVNPKNQFKPSKTLEGFFKTGEKE